jgi:hypothetical protein
MSYLPEEPWIQALTGEPSIEQALEFNYCAWCLLHAEVDNLPIPNDPNNRRVVYQVYKDHARVLSGLPDGFLNWIAWSDLSTAHLSERISEISDQVADFLGGASRGCEWTVLGSQPNRDQLILELERQGWHFYYAVPGMTCDLVHCGDEPRSSEFEVRVVRTNKEIDDWLKPFLDGFDISDGGASHFKRVLERVAPREDAPFQNFTLYEASGVNAGRPISCGSIVYRYGVAVICDVGTIFGARCRGAATHMVRFLKSEARRRGYRSVSLFAAPEAQSIYLKERFVENATSYSLYRKELGAC